MPNMSDAQPWPVADRSVQTTDFMLRNKLYKIVVTISWHIYTIMAFVYRKYLSFCECGSPALNPLRKKGHWTPIHGVATIGEETGAALPGGASFNSTYFLFMLSS